LLADRHCEPKHTWLRYTVPDYDNKYFDDFGQYELLCAVFELYKDDDGNSGYGGACCAVLMRDGWRGSMVLVYLLGYKLSCS
jgi:hypothetical protein